MQAHDTFGQIAVIIMMVSGMGILATMYRQRLLFRHRALELKVELARLEVEARRADPGQATLENRVRVLERIATDTSARKARDLATQIDALAKPDPLLN